MAYHQQPPSYQHPTPQQPPKKRRKWPWVLGGIAAVIVVFGVFGSSGSDTETASTPPVEQAADLVPPTPATAERQGPVTLAFGETHSWTGGEAITVSVPREYVETNQFLAPPEGKRYVSLDVTVKNNGNDEYQVMQTSLTVQHNGRVGQQNYMAGDGLPNVKLPPGGQTIFTAVFEIGAEPGELQVSVEPNMFAANTVYFKGQF